MAIVTKPRFRPSVSTAKSRYFNNLRLPYQTHTQARHDLARVNATIRLFTEPEHQRARYMVSHGFFKKGEIADICVRHLGVDGEMTTRQLAERVMAERKLDASDRTLRNSVVFKVVQALRHAKRRKLVRMVRFESRGIPFDDTERLLELANAYVRGQRPEAEC